MWHQSSSIQIHQGIYLCELESNLNGWVIVDDVGTYREYCGIAALADIQVRSRSVVITFYIGNITCNSGYLLFEMIPALDALLGNPTAARVLMYLENYDSGYAKRISDTFDIPVNMVQDQLKKFEAAGVLTSTTVGRTRVFSFNPRNPTAKNLRIFLSSELDGLPGPVCKNYFRDRQRPRRTGKPLSRT